MSDDNSIETSSRFLASTLHEVRTPIQTIISTTELLGDTQLDKEQTEYVRQIEFSANVLLQLANDVLDFTKIRSKEFKLESIPYDVIELTEHVVDLVSIDAFSKGLEVVTDIDYSMQRNVMGDPTRVQQILLNLVKNAVKFTTNGFIYIKLSCTNKNLFFQVIDSGIGVPPEKKDLVFKAFSQADASTTRKYGGTGLGLTISKNLVEVMKGNIGVKSSPKGGSNFWFTIPLNKANFGTEKQTSQLHKNLKILIAESNKLAQTTFEKKLKSLGITEIKCVNTGKQAIAVLKEHSKNGIPFTTAFISVQLSPMDGWEIASAIKNDLEIASLKLFITIPEGQLGKEAKMKMKDLYDGYIYKPIKQNQLFAILNDKEYKASQLEKNIKKEETKLQDTTIAKGFSILIAEDHPVNRKLLTTFLTKYGADVFIAENGQQAVEQIAAHPEMDIIFMDIFMPVKNGIDATLEIRSSGYNGIIIACTANNDPEDINTYTKMGINDILIKPYKRDSIKTMLEKWNTVLSLPEARQIMSIADMTNDGTEELWDIDDFMDTTAGDKELAHELIEEYVKQTHSILEYIKALSAKAPDFEKFRSESHTLKGSSASVSAYKLRDFAKEMEEAAKSENMHKFETARLNFAMDFIKLKNIVRNWEETR